MRRTSLEPPQKRGLRLDLTGWDCKDGPLVPIQIEGTGVCLPERILTNRELEGMVDTSDAWIVERTGIRERRIAASDVATSDLCAEAVIQACRDAEIDPSDLDALNRRHLDQRHVLSVNRLLDAEEARPDRTSGVRRQRRCSGFLYALELAASLLTSNRHERIAIVGGEVMSKVIDWTDRSTCVLFGDGAGAAIVCRPDHGNSGLLGSAWGADGQLAPLLQQPAGGTQRPATAATVAEHEHTVRMDGPAVFRHAVVAMTDAAKAAMAKARVAASDVSLLIPHQANHRIMDLTRERCGIAEDRMYSIVERYGNMSAATIPVALHEAKSEGRVQSGDLILMTAFGTGFTGLRLSFAGSATWARN